MIVMPYSCISLSMDLFVLCVVCVTVIVNCLKKQFAIFFGCGCNFLIECYGVVECGWRCYVG